MYYMWAKDNLNGQKYGELLRSNLYKPSRRKFDPLRPHLRQKSTGCAFQPLIMDKLIISVICTLSIVQLTIAEPACHATEIGACVDFAVNYINFLPRRTAPETKDDVTAICKEITNMVDCWDDYKSRCMSPIQAELEGLITEGLRALDTGFCTPGSPLSTKYLQHAECYSRALKTDTASEIIDRIIAMFEEFDNMKLLPRVSYFCCSWNQMYTAVMDMSKSECGAEAVDVLEEMISTGFSVLPGISCGGFDVKGDQCQKVLLPEGTKPTGKSNPFVNAVRYIFKTHLD